MIDKFTVNKQFMSLSTNRVAYTFFSILLPIKRIELAVSLHSRFASFCTLRTLPAFLHSFASVISVQFQSCSYFCCCCSVYEKIEYFLKSEEEFFPYGTIIWVNVCILETINLKDVFLTQYIMFIFKFSFTIKINKCLNIYEYRIK